jgi:hypothetical protein
MAFTASLEIDGAKAVKLKDSGGSLGTTFTDKEMIEAHRRFERNCWYVCQQLARVVTSARTWIDRTRHILDGKDTHLNFLIFEAAFELAFGMKYDDMNKRERDSFSKKLSQTMLGLRDQITVKLYGNAPRTRGYVHTDYFYKLKWYGFAYPWQRNVHIGADDIGTGTVRNLDAQARERIDIRLAHTLIHESTHKFASTDDFYYKRDAEHSTPWNHDSGRVTRMNGLNNADSYAWLCRTIIQTIGPDEMVSAPRGSYEYTSEWVDDGKKQWGLIPELEG